MSGAVAWALAAAAALLVPSVVPTVGRRGAARRAADSGPGADSRPGVGRPGSPPRDGDEDAPGAHPPAGTALAVAAVAGACVAALGPRTGLVAAAVLGPAVGAVLNALQRRPGRERADPALPLALDLVAAALRSGRPLPDALARAAPAAAAGGARSLLRVAGLLRLGADPAQAWSAIPRASPLAPVAAVAVRSAASGIKLAAAFERLAADRRAEQSAAATARAHRAGIVAMAPLAACFLPSFVCLGVVPVVVGIARTAVGVVP